MAKTKVKSIENKGPVVTASERGTSVIMQVAADTELQSLRRVQVVALISDRPFVLGRPSAVGDISFVRQQSVSDEEWLLKRGLIGLLSGNNPHILQYTDTTSPQSSDNGGDDWQTDDSQNDGGPED